MDNFLLSALKGQQQLLPLTYSLFLEHILEKSLPQHITKIDKDRHVCYTEQKNRGGRYV